MTDLLPITQHTHTSSGNTGSLAAVLGVLFGSTLLLLRWGPSSHAGTYISLYSFLHTPKNNKNKNPYDEKAPNKSTNIPTPPTKPPQGTLRGDPNYVDPARVDPSLYTDFTPQLILREGHEDWVAFDRAAAPRYFTVRACCKFSASSVVCACFYCIFLFIFSLKT